MIMKILKKEWLIWSFLKKGGSREKGGGGNKIHGGVVFFAIKVIAYSLINDYKELIKTWKIVIAMK